MSRPLRVGMIGVGRHARTILLPSIAQIPEYMQVVALATAHEETARAAAAQFHIPAHVGYEALVADPAVVPHLVSLLQGEAAGPWPRLVAATALGNLAAYRSGDYACSPCLRCDPCAHVGS